MTPKIMKWIQYFGLLSWSGVCVDKVVSALAKNGMRTGIVLGLCCGLACDGGLSGYDAVPADVAGLFECGTGT